MKKIFTAILICGLTNFAFSQNFGIDQPSPTRKLDVNGDIRLSPGYQLYFGENVTTPGKIGLNFHTDGDPNYGIYKPAGAWTQPLHIGFYTGVKIGANTAYGGTKFYNSSDMGTEIMSIGNGDNHVRIGGYMFSQYVNTTDNVVSSGVTGIMVKQGDNYYRTANAAAIQAFIGSSGADNLGNHTATTTLNMNNQSISNVSDIYAVQNYGRGLVGVYSDTRYQNVWAMGTSWRLAADGTTPGNLYGIAWTHSNIGGQSRAGLSHQMLVMENGATKVALGSGVWTAYVTQADQGFNVDGNTVIDDGAGWHRSYGATGWYNGTYGGGWYMTDGTWVRTYNSKPITFGLGAGSSAAQFGGIINSNSTSDSHQINPLTGNWGYIGTSGQYWFYMYSQNFVDPSQRKLKRDITPVDDNLMAYVMKDIEKIKPSFYKYKSESDEMVPGFEAKYRPNMHLGVILDETPDYLQDQAFSGVDIYALGAFALTGVKYQQKQIKELQQQVNNNIAIGNASMTSNTFTVQLPAGFYNSWEVPFITITPTSPNSGFYVNVSDSKSFTVTSVSPMSFNWQAVRSSNRVNEKAVPAIDLKLADQLVVDQSKKAKIQEYWRKDKERMQGDYQAYLEGLKADDPVQYARLKEENRLAESFAATSGKSGGYDVEAMRNKSATEVKRRKAEMDKVNKSNLPDPTKSKVVAPLKQDVASPQQLPTQPNSKH